MTQSLFDKDEKIVAGPVLRPKDAATLIIVRRDAEKPRVLMGLRGSGHDFMPDKWVFPGGRIDRSDFRAPTANELRPDVAARLAEGAIPRRARALALSAIRETFEETGLALGVTDRGAPPRRPRAPGRALPRPACFPLSRASTSSPAR